MLHPCLSLLTDKLWFQKNSEKKLFLWNQSINVIYPNEENVFMVPNREIKRDYYIHPCLSQLTDEFWFQKNYGKKSFLIKPMHPNEEKWLLHVPKFVSIDERNLVLRKWWKEKHFLWTKASMSSIPKSRMCLWWSITKRMKIIMSIHVCLI